jgi:hypothetical protein
VKHRIRKAAFALLTLFLIDVFAQSTVLTVLGDGLSEYPTLREAISQYYSAEARNDWHETYRFRPRAFRKMVSFSVYEREMKKGSSGWELTKVTIVQAKHGKDDEIVVSIQFTESFDSTIAKSRFDARVSQGTNTIVEDTVWKVTNGSWSCLEAGTRRHLALNDRTVY